MITKIIAALMFVVGIGAAGFSLITDVNAGGVFATLAVAAFAFAGAAGIWHISYVIETHLSDLYDDD